MLKEHTILLTALLIAFYQKNRKNSVDYLINISKIYSILVLIKKTLFDYLSDRVCNTIKTIINQRNKKNIDTYLKKHLKVLN